MGIVRSEAEGNGLMSVRRRRMTLETQLSTESGQRKQNQMWANFWKGIGPTKLMRQHFVFWSSLNSTKSKTLASLHMCFKQQVERETKPSHESRDCIDSHKANSFWNPATSSHPTACAVQAFALRLLLPQTPSTWLKAGAVRKSQWVPSGLTVSLSFLQMSFSFANQHWLPCNGCLILKVDLVVAAPRKQARCRKQHTGWTPSPSRAGRGQSCSSGSLGLVCELLWLCLKSGCPSTGRHV